MGPLEVFQVMLEEWEAQKGTTKDKESSKEQKESQSQSAANPTLEEKGEEGLNLAKSEGLEVTPEQESQMKEDWEQGWTEAVEAGLILDGGDGTARLTEKGARWFIINQIHPCCHCPKCRVVQACGEVILGSY